MAIRNYWTIIDSKICKGTVEFKWEPGMSTAQRRRSCQNMQNVIRLHKLS